MAEYYDIDGNKIEAVSKEEHEKEMQKIAADTLLAAQKDGKIVTKEEYDKVNTKVIDLEKQVKDATDALEKAGNKDQNFEALRKAKEAAESALADYKKTNEDRLQAIEKQLPGNNIEESIMKLAGGDKEMEKKIKFHYDRIVNSNDTIADKQQKLIDAATLAKGSRPSPSLVSGVLSGAGAPSRLDMKDGDEINQLKPEQAELAKKMGITDKDVAKFGNHQLDYKTRNEK